MKNRAFTIFMSIIVMILLLIPEVWLAKGIVSLIGVDTAITIMLTVFLYMSTLKLISYASDKVDKED